MKSYDVMIGDSKVTTVLANSPKEAVREAHRALDRASRRDEYKAWLRTGGQVRETQPPSISYELVWVETGHTARFLCEGLVVEMWTGVNEFKCEHPNEIQASEAFGHQVADYLAMGWRVGKVWQDGELVTHNQHYYKN